MVFGATQEIRFQKIKEKHAVNDILKLDQHVLCMLCCKDADAEQRLKVTTKLGKDYYGQVPLKGISFCSW